MKRRIVKDLFRVSMIFVLVFICYRDSSAVEGKYPSGSIELICGHSVGGTPDLFNRIWARHLEKRLGVPVAPINKPGAGGVIATAYVANSRPGGYTLLTNPLNNVLIPLVTGQATYSLEDLRLICQVASFRDLLVVRADSMWRTFQEFVDYARKNPGVKYGHPGIGGALNLRIESLSKYLNLRLVGVPFRGGDEENAALLGGHVPVIGMGLAAILPYVNAGKMRILFSFDPLTGLGLDPSIPDLPTLFGKDVPDIKPTVCLWAPRKTPDEIVQVLESSMREIAKDHEFDRDTKKVWGFVDFIDGKTVMQKIVPRLMPQIKEVVQFLESGK